MCGIIGVFDNKEAVSQVAQALSIIENRGKDGIGIATSKDISHFKNFNKKNQQKISKIKDIHCIGHCLHSIVGYVPHPFEGKGKFIANCEIYNWKELNKKYNLKAKNDAELLFLLLEKNNGKNIKKILNEIQGVYAFAYWINDEIILARDIIGVKPLWVCLEPNFAFSSEKKALKKLGYDNIRELNPRKIIKYNTKTNRLQIKQRKFFSYNPEHKVNHARIKEEVRNLLFKAVEKRIPDKKFGLLFSGGIDSTLIALIAKKLNKKFICYTAALEEKGMEPAPDFIYAKKVSKLLNLPLKVKKLSIKQIEKELPKVVPLIEDSNVIKVGVGLTFHEACKLAKKDKIKVIFSGLGSEEIFAGYERHKQSINVNKECLSGILKIYERDLYRDDVITMNNNLELRLPFLDKQLVDFSLKIPAKYKLNKEQSKIIIREIAKDLGLPEEFAERKKKAAQYGSKFDRAIQKLAGKSKKSEYLNQFLKYPIMKLGVLFSSGKDSAYAAYIMRRQNYNIACLIAIKSENPSSYMYHTPNIGLVTVQAKAMDIPLILQTTKGKKEAELKDLEKALARAIKEFNIEGVVSGALFSNYQRERVEKVADKIGLKIFSPLWHMDQELEMRDLLKKGFEVHIAAIAAYGFVKTWLGKKITSKEIDDLVKLNKKYHINVAGEGGEFETFVTDSPMFKQKIRINQAKAVMEDENTGQFLIKKVSLIKK